MWGGMAYHLQVQMTEDGKILISFFYLVSQVTHSGGNLQQYTVNIHAACEGLA